MLRQCEDHLRFLLWCVSVLEDDDDDEGSRCQRGGDESDDVIRNILQQAKHETMNDAPVRQEEEDYGTLELSVQSSADFVQSIIQKVKCEINEDTEPSVPPSSVSRWFQTLAADPDQRAQGFKMETRQRPRSCPISSSCELQSLCLDTFSITQRVKETLTANSIGVCSPHPIRVCDFSGHHFHLLEQKTAEHIPQSNMSSIIRPEAFTPLTNNTIIHHFSHLNKHHI